NLITPIVDGHIRSYFDWFGAGIAGTKNRSSAMHNSSRRSVFDKVLFGFNIETLFLRFDPSEDFSEYFSDEKLQLDVTFGAPENARDFHIILEPCASDSRKVEINFNDGEFLPCEIAFERILEVGINFDILVIQPDEKISFRIDIWSGDRIVGRVPDHLEIEFFSPTEDYDSLMWRI
ncbi:hypothetical protein K8T06_07660, partial [bacterium]|nr:hypothetical protein [bacterium]